MKKYCSILLAVVLVFSLAACGGAASSAPASQPDSVSQPASVPEVPTEVTIKSLNAEKVEADLVVPFDPQRIVVLDYAALDMIDNFGYGDRVVGASKGSSISYLQSYMDDNSIANCGTIKEADMEAIMQAEPDVIFIGGRLSSVYAELSQFAPGIFGNRCRNWRCGKRAQKRTDHCLYVWLRRSR